MADLVTAALAARDGSVPAPPDLTGSTRQRLPLHHLRRDVSMSGTRRPRRRSWRALFWAAGIATALSAGFYGAQGAGWSSGLLMRIEATIWPTPHAPAAVLAPVAGTPDQPAPQHDPAPRQDEDALSRALAQHQRLMLDATAQEWGWMPAQPLQAEDPKKPDEAESASPVEPGVTPADPPLLAGPADARAAEPAAPIASQRSTPRPSRRAAPRRAVTPRNNFMGDTYWDAPGYTAR